MLPLIKLLKIVLPVATVTTATIITTSLVSSSKNNLEKNKQEQDKLLLDFEKPVKDFKEEIMLYSDKGQADNATVSKDQADRLKDVQLQDALDVDVDKELNELIEGSKEPKNNRDLTSANKPLSEPAQTNEAEQGSVGTDKLSPNILATSSEKAKENKSKTGIEGDDEILSKSEMGDDSHNLINDNLQSEHPKSKEDGDLGMEEDKDDLQKPQLQDASEKQQQSNQNDPKNPSQETDSIKESVSVKEQKGDENSQTFKESGGDLKQERGIGSASGNVAMPSEENLDELKSLLDELQSTTKELEGFVLN